jgi:hypothetical protein
MKDFEPMRDLYEPLSEFLTFNRGNELAKLIGHVPVDQIILDEIKDEGRGAEATLFFYDEPEVKPLGLKVFFGLDKEGIPISARFTKI